MNILSWNCRGLGNPRTILELRDIIRAKSPDVVFLCETKCKVHDIDRIKNSLGFFGVAFPSSGRSGGLALLWKKSISLVLRSFCDRFIDADILWMGSSIRITGVYGQPDVSLRRQFWQFFKTLHCSPEVPWICFGDFNEVLLQNEFEGTGPRATWQINNFRDALDHCNLQDMGFFGNRFTWHRLAVHPHTQRARLDRSVCNNLCRDIFPSWKVSNNDTYSSDHAYLFINLHHSHTSKFSPGRRSKPFRFEAMWIRSKECEKVISEHWNSSWDNIGDKLNNCKIGLLNWSKNTFATKETLNLLNTQLDALITFNDLKWKQRAKQHWYREGDRNSKFFHAMASMRKEINHISSLKDENGQIYSEVHDIEKIIGKYFADIFSSSSPSTTDIEQAISRVRPKVTPAMKEFLRQPFTSEEVTRALKHMHPFKSPGPDANGWPERPSADLKAHCLAEKKPLGPRIFFDGAISASYAGIGVATFDSSGTFIHGFSKKVIGISEAEIAEVLALKEALNLGKQLNLSLIEIYGDATTIILAVNGEAFFPRSCISLADDVLLLKAQVSVAIGPPSGSLELVSDGVDRLRLQEGNINSSHATVEDDCEQMYGFLPCSKSIPGHVFLIVVYEYLLFHGESYVASGGERIFKILGPGVFGACAFQIIGSLPEALILLASGLLNNKEAAQELVLTGVGLLAGSSILLLTLVWGTCVILGSQDFPNLSHSNSSSPSDCTTKQNPLERLFLSLWPGYGVVTDYWTGYTARIMLVSELNVPTQIAKILIMDMGIISGGSRN
ncbi:hypothetical protein DH2020_031703 [Rehmannia glutinosa]|uniref:RNase H type-1 domain-containing protein n=1 Tax=Rehmannia glutinosa TaxID=99300 RepID=A0ABR0VH94_REHGL